MFVAMVRPRVTSVVFRISQPLPVFTDKQTSRTSHWGHKRQSKRRAISCTTLIHIVQSPLDDLSDYRHDGSLAVLPVTGNKEIVPSELNQGTEAAPQRSRGEPVSPYS